MTQPALPLDGQQHPIPRRTLAEELPSAVVEPILAGVRARRVADACEAAGLAAVLVDASGRVLHMASRARSLLGPQIAVVADHLIGQTRADNEALEAALSAAVSGEDAPADQGAAKPDGGLRMTGFRYDDSSYCQLLRGIVVLTAPGEALDTAALRALLAA